MSLNRMKCAARAARLVAQRVAMARNRTHSGIRWIELDNVKRCAEHVANCADVMDEGRLKDGVKELEGMVTESVYGVKKKNDIEELMESMKKVC